MKTPYDYALMVHTNMISSLLYNEDKERWYKKIRGDDGKLEEEYYAKSKIVNRIYALRKELIDKLDEEFMNIGFTVSLCKKFINKSQDISQLKKNAFVNNIYKHLCQIRSLPSNQRDAYKLTFGELNELIESDL